MELSGDVLCSEDLHSRKSRTGADALARSESRTRGAGVNWRSITADGVATTNYQLLPGDRVYVQAGDLIATDNFLAKVIAPVNRGPRLSAFGSVGG